MMLLRNKKNIIKIFLAVFATVMVVQYLNKNVFIANSPQVRPDAGSMLVTAFGDTITGATTLLARLFGGSKSPSEQLANDPFRKISNGVYAKSSADNEVGVVEFKMNEMEFVTYTYNVNGRQVPVTVPKDMQPPPQEIVNNMYK